MNKTLRFLRSALIRISLINILLLGVVFGQCTSKGSVSSYLGSYPSFQIKNIHNVSKTKMPETGLNCNFKALLSLLGTSDKINVSLPVSDMILKHEQDARIGISFMLYTDQALQDPIIPGSSKRYNMGRLIDILGIFGDGNKNMEMPMYIQILPIPNETELLAGKYRANIVLQWDWDICKGVSILFICLGRDKGSALTNLIIDLDIEQDCLINATDINFGTQSFVTDFSPVNGTIHVSCTKGEIYSVGLSEGGNAISNQRNMRSGNDLIAYEIYKGDGTSRDIWGKMVPTRRLSTEADINPGVGTGSSKVGQIYRYQAEILPLQDEKPVGKYIDHIVIDIGF